MKAKVEPSLQTDNRIQQIRFPKGNQFRESGKDWSTDWIAIDMLSPKNWTAWYDRIMNNIKRVFTSSFKAKVALDLIRETDSIARLCFVHGIHPTQPGKWKSLAIAGLPAIFDNAPDQRLQEKDDLIENLYRQIGKLQVELDWLKKRPTRHKAETFALLEPSHPDLYSNTSEPHPHHPVFPYLVRKKKILALNSRHSQFRSGQPVYEL